ncbi:MAG: lamin tail domain-containing protein [Paludibacteraceae bacterium]
MKKIFLLSTLFVALLFTSCVKDEIYVGSASIEQVTRNPTDPNEAATPIVTAKITDLKGISTVKLYYKASTETNFNSVDMTLTEGRIYAGTIPAFAKDVKVEYYIEATNLDNLKTLYPKEAPTKLDSYTIGAAPIVLYINEVFSDGTKDTTDPDWFEIYNASEISVDLKDYQVYDEGIKTSLSTASPKAKRVLSSIVIPAKGYAVITTEYNGESVMFGLSTAGDAVYLENHNGVLVSSLDFGTIGLAGKKSYGHKPDGTGALTTFTTPTKGASNNNAN